MILPKPQRQPLHTGHRGAISGFSSLSIVFSQPLTRS
jgi:hypothetical protein